VHRSVRDVAYNGGEEHCLDACEGLSSEAVQQVRIPILWISERIRFGDLSIAIAASMDAVFEHAISLRTLVFYLPGPEPRIPTEGPSSLIPRIRS